MTNGRIPIDPNMLSWAQGFINVIRSFKEGHEIDKMIATNIVAEARAAENCGKTHSSITSRAVFLFQEDTLGSHTPTDEEDA